MRLSNPLLHLHHVIWVSHLPAKQKLVLVGAKAKRKRLPRTSSPMRKRRCYKQLFIMKCKAFTAQQDVLEAFAILDADRAGVIPGPHAPPPPSFCFIQRAFMQAKTSWWRCERWATNRLLPRSSEPPLIAAAPCADFGRCRSLLSRIDRESSGMVSAEQVVGGGGG